jgi:ATP-binding cassette, subfamily B, bacterial
MNPRLKKFFSYYKPYSNLFYADMACAVIASAAMLAVPLCVRYITTNLLHVGSTDALHQIYMMGGLMLGLIAIYAACHAFIDYKGHPSLTLASQASNN